MSENARPFALSDGSTIHLSPDRYKAAQLLVRNEWWGNTEGDVQRELLALPEGEGRTQNWTPLLLHLAAHRPDSGGGKTLVRLVDHPHGNYGGIPVFLVKDDGTADEDATQTYEALEWANGDFSGYKVAVVVESPQGLEGVVLLNGFRHATGTEELGSPGGFAQIGKDGVKTVMDRILVELRQELNLPGLKVLGIKLFGRLLVDPGLCGNRPGIAMVKISSEDAARLSEEQVNVDKLEYQAGPRFYPMDRLGQLLGEVDESFLLAIFARLLGEALRDGRITLWQLFGERIAA